MRLAERVDTDTGRMVAHPPTRAASKASCLAIVRVLGHTMRGILETPKPEARKHATTIAGQGGVFSAVATESDGPKQAYEASQ